MGVSRISLGQSSRLAHLRDAQAVGQRSGEVSGNNSRIWGEPRWITPLPTRTFQIQEVPEHTLDPEVSRLVTYGTDYTAAIYDTPAPQPVRPSNLGSYFVSDPAPFQSYFKVHWEDMFGARANLAEGTRKMSPLYNPIAPGRAEGQAVQQYNPWPSYSQLSPTYPGSELKAV